MQPQGTQKNAKEDTVFLALDGDLATDLSQYETNLTPTTGGGFELDSARAALTGSTGREIYVRCEMTAAEANIVLAAHSTTVEFAYTWLIRTNASGALVCVQGNTFVGLTTVWQGPVVPAADLSIGWSTRPNPDTTGASDALISEIVVYDHDAGAYLAIDQVVHATPTTSSGFVLSVGGVYSAGSLASRPTNAPTAFRLSKTFHPSVEFAEDWVGPRPDAKSRPQNFPLVGPIPPTSGLGDENQWAGAANVGYAKRVAQLSTSAYRYAPLINETYRDPKRYYGDVLANKSPQWFHPLPRRYMDLSTLRWIKMPRSTGLKAVTSFEPPFTETVEQPYPQLASRVFLKTWLDDPGDPVPLRVHLVAMSRPLYWEQSVETATPVPDFAFASVNVIITEDHTGDGRWVELPTLDVADLIPVGGPWKDGLFLCLALEFSDTAPNAVEARAYIKCWQVRPAWPAAWEVV